MVNTEATQILVYIEHNTWRERKKACSILSPRANWGKTEGMVLSNDAEGAYESLMRPLAQQGEGWNEALTE